MGFDCPWALLLLPLVMFLLMARLRAQETVALRPGRASLAIWAACLAVGILALSRPFVAASRPGLDLVMVVDVSQSLAEADLEGMGGLLSPLTSSLGPHDRLGLITFGAMATVRLPLGKPSALEHDPLGPIRAGRLQDQPEATDLGQALDLAGSLLSSERGPGRLPMVLLVSDGRDTEGRGREAARHLAGQGVGLWALAAALPRPQASLDQLLTPPTAEAGAEISALVRVSSSQKGHATLRGEMDGEPLRSIGLDLDQGSRWVALPLRLEGPGRHGVRFWLQAPWDESQGDNAVEGQVRVRGAVSGLCLSPGGLCALPWFSPGVADITSLAPTWPLPLEGRDMVILEDMAPGSLAEGAWEGLAAWVQGGGGLMVVAGPLGGRGGYRGTALEELLPVRFGQGGDEGRVAAVIAVDRSGSMEQALPLAREALGAMARPVDRPRDKLGLIAFDVEPRVLRSLAPVGQGALAAGLEGLEARGGTDAMPALRMAASWLEGETSATRIIILITDGKFKEGGMGALVRRLSGLRIRVVVVAVGSSPQLELLTRLARGTGGEVLRAASGQGLPKARFKAATAVGRMRKGPFIPLARQGPSGLAEALAGPVPEVRAYWAGMLAPGAEAVLEAGPLHEPLLAVGSVGSGRVAMVTAGGDWIPGWSEWVPSSPLWDQLAQWLTSPSRGEAGVEVEGLGGDRYGVRAVLMDPQGAPVLDAGLVLLHPSGEIPMGAVAPGVYEAQLSLPPGHHALRVASREGGALVERGRREISLLAQGEGRGEGSDLEALAALAGRGRLLEPGRGLPPLPPQAPWPLWPPLAGLALALYGASKLFWSHTLR